MSRQSDNQLMEQIILLTELETRQLDTSAPLERLQTILQDAKSPILIIQKSKLNSLPKITDNLQTICIDDGLDLSGFPNEITYQSEVTSENLAYVMYTSGSTGKPKEVCILLYLT